MRGRREERIEAAIDHVAAALFGLAAGWISHALLAGALHGLPLWASAAGCASFAYLVVRRLLGAVQPLAPMFELGSFTPLDLELEDPDELLLTEQVELLLTNSDRLDPPPGDVLVLDDILAELGPGSRVVRLFDPASTPSPGQLNARIEQHLRDGTSQAAPLDASQALHEALAELRRSLR